MQGTVLYGPRDIRFEDRRSAQLAQAKAMLANAQAVQRRTELNVERYTPFGKEQPASEISTTRSKQSRRTGKDRDGQSANQDLRGSPRPAQDSGALIELKLGTRKGFIGNHWSRCSRCLASQFWPCVSTSTRCKNALTGPFPSIRAANASASASICGSRRM